MQRLVSTLLAGCLLFAACAVRSPSRLEYRVVRRDAKAVLVSPAADSGVISFRLDRRPADVRGSDCSFSEGAFHLSIRDNVVEVTTPEIHLDDQGRVPLELMTGFGTFYQALHDLERRGCWEQGVANRLERAVLEQQTVPLIAAGGLLQGSLVYRGYVDMGPLIRLNVVGPVRAPATGEVIGVETAHYRFEPGAEGGWRMHVESVERTIEGKTRSASQPRESAFEPPGQAAFFRLFLMTRLSDSNHDIALLATETADRMERLTPELIDRPERCLSGDFSEPAWCFAAPRSLAINAEVPVRLNKSRTSVPLNSSIRHALRQAGVNNPSAVLETLEVRRRFGDRRIPVVFDRTESDILELILVGGEELEW